KYTMNGGVIWTQKYGAPPLPGNGSALLGYSVAVDGSGNIAVGGHMEIDAVFDYDFIMRLDTDGTFNTGTGSWFTYWDSHGGDAGVTDMIFRQDPAHPGSLAATSVDVNAPLLVPCFTLLDWSSASIIAQFNVANAYNYDTAAIGLTRSNLLKPRIVQSATNS